MPYYLVAGPTCAAHVERDMGLRAWDTPLGTLVEKPPENGAQLANAMARINAALNPNRCTCGAWAIIHRPGCPVGDVTT